MRRSPAIHPCERRAPDRSPPGLATAAGTDGTGRSPATTIASSRSPIGTQPMASRRSTPCSTRSSSASTAARVGATRSCSRRAWHHSSGGELVAVHAYPYDLFISRGVTPDFESIMHANAEDTLMGELERANVVAHAAAVPDGSPGRALHRAVKRHRGDLIVVGSAHRGVIGRVLAGDVTMGTLHGAECPVVVAPQGFAATCAGAGDDRRRLRRLAGVTRRRRAGTRPRGRHRRAVEGRSASWSRCPPAGRRSATTQTGRSTPRSAATRPRQSSMPSSPSSGTSRPARSSSAIRRPSWPTPATTSTCW